MNNVRSILLAALIVLSTAVMIGFLMSFPVMWTWNAVMPYMFGLKVLTWGKAWCLSFLSFTLIKTTITK